MALVYQCDASSTYMNGDLIVCDVPYWADLPVSAGGGACSPSSFLDVTDPVFLQLLASVLALFALAFVINFLFKFIINR